MLPALLLIPLVALFRIFLAWQPVDGASTWLLGASPLAAVALCGGLFLPRRLALAVPLGILLLSDAVIDAHYGANFFAVSLLARYVLLAFIGLGGMAVRRGLNFSFPGVLPTLAATLASSAFFYMASNTLTWLGSHEYAQNAAGLWQALTVGLPGLSAVVPFFPKRTCQRRALFYRVPRLRPPDAAYVGNRACARSSLMAAVGRG